jgi:hypothetical protein
MPRILFKHPATKDGTFINNCFSHLVFNLCVRIFMTDIHNFTISVYKKQIRKYAVEMTCITFRMGPFTDNFGQI